MGHIFSVRAQHVSSEVILYEETIQIPKSASSTVKQQWRICNRPSSRGFMLSQWNRN